MELAAAGLCETGLAGIFAFAAATKSGASEIGVAVPPSSWDATARSPLRRGGRGAGGGTARGRCAADARARGRRRRTRERRDVPAVRRARRTDRRARADCGYTIKQEWPALVGTDAAARVAAATLDAGELLARERTAGRLRRDFTRPQGSSAITCPATCARKTSGRRSRAAPDDSRARPSSRSSAARRSTAPGG